MFDGSDVLFNDLNNMTNRNDFDVYSIDLNNMNDVNDLNNRNDFDVLFNVDSYYFDYLFICLFDCLDYLFVYLIDFNNNYSLDHILYESLYISSYSLDCFFLFYFLCLFYCFYVDCLFSCLFDFYFDYYYSYLYYSNLSYSNYFNLFDFYIDCDNFCFIFDCLIDFYFIYYFDFDCLIDFYFSSFNTVLLLPCLSSIKLICYSIDLIHSFGIYSLGVKQDCIPGNYNNTSTIRSLIKGEHRGFCYELCGYGHSSMLIVGMTLVFTLILVILKAFRLQ